MDSLPVKRNLLPEFNEIAASNEFTFPGKFKRSNRTLICGDGELIDLQKLFSCSSEESFNYRFLKIPEDSSVLGTKTIASVTVPTNKYNLRSALASALTKHEQSELSASERTVFTNLLSLASLQKRNVVIKINSCPEFVPTIFFNNWCVPDEILCLDPEFKKHFYDTAVAELFNSFRSQLTKVKNVQYIQKCRSLIKSTLNEFKNLSNEFNCDTDLLGCGDCFLGLELDSNKIKIYHNQEIRSATVEDDWLTIHFASSLDPIPLQKQMFLDYYRREDRPLRANVMNILYLGTVTDKFVRVKVKLNKKPIVKRFEEPFCLTNLPVSIDWPKEEQNFAVRSVSQSAARFYKSLNKSVNRATLRRSGLPDLYLNFKNGKLISVSDQKKVPMVQSAHDQDCKTLSKFLFYGMGSSISCVSHIFHSSKSFDMFAEMGYKCRPLALSPCPPVLPFLTETGYEFSFLKGPLLELIRSYENKINFGTDAGIAVEKILSPYPFAQFVNAKVPKDQLFRCWALFNKIQRWQIVPEAVDVVEFNTLFVRLLKHAVPNKFCLFFNHDLRQWVVGCVLNEPNTYLCIDRISMTVQQSKVLKYFKFSLSTARGYGLFEINTKTNKVVLVLPQQGSQRVHVLDSFRINFHNVVIERVHRIKLGNENTLLGHVRNVNLSQYCLLQSKSEMTNLSKEVIAENRKFFNESKPFISYFKKFVDPYFLNSVFHDSLKDIFSFTDENEGTKSDLCSILDFSFFPSERKFISLPNKNMVEQPQPPQDECTNEQMFFRIMDFEAKRPLNQISAQLVGKRVFRYKEFVDPFSEKGVLARIRESDAKTLKKLATFLKIVAKKEFVRSFVKPFQLLNFIKDAENSLHTSVLTFTTSGAKEHRQYPLNKGALDNCTTAIARNQVTKLDVSKINFKPIGEFFQVKCQQNNLLKLISHDYASFVFRRGTDQIVMEFVFCVTPKIFSMIIGNDNRGARPRWRRSNSSRFATPPRKQKPKVQLRKNWTDPRFRR